MKIRYSRFPVLCVLFCLLFLPASEAQTDLQELETNRAQWESLGLENYEFNYRAVIMLPPPFSDTLLVRVYQNQVARVFWNGQDVTEEVLRSITIPTMDGIFNRLQSELLANPFSYAVSYYSAQDGYAGYPTSVNINPVQMIIDEEVRWTISNVWRLTALDELEQAQQTWSSYQIFDYTFYSIDSNLDKYIVHVENEQVALTTNFFGDPVDDSLSGIVIPELFPILANRILDGVQAIDITYHDVYGYPAIFGPPGAYESINFLTPYTILSQGLANAMELWERRDVTAYSFMLKIVAFREEKFNQPNLIQVDTNGNIYNTSAFLAGTLAEIQTVDAFFAQIQQAILDRKPEIVVNYHGEYGYPTSIFIDSRVAVADDEYYAYMSNLVPVRDTPEQAALSAARFLWTSQATLDVYAFSYERLCLCSLEYRGPWMVRVQDGLIIHVETRADGTSVSLTSDVQNYISTIDALFDHIQTAIQVNSAEILVTYNETLGFPESVFIDYEDIADDEFSVRVDVFAPIGSWQPQLDQGKQTWESQGIQSYTYQYDQDTQDIDAAGPKLVEVLDGVVVSVDGESVQAIARSSLSEIPTIDDLFLRIQEAIDMDAFSVQVAYDEETGHPFDIYIDYDDRIGDDEWIVRATYPVDIDSLINDVATDPPTTMAPTAAATNDPVIDDPVIAKGTGSGTSMLTISTYLGHLTWMAMVLPMVL
jgi:hypothetical protein